MQKKYDYVVIGAGIVGLSIGNSLLEKNPRAQVLIADKEKTLGAHASGRNSGVLHAGFYYSKRQKTHSKNSYSSLNKISKYIKTISCKLLMEN